jgi:hypothetical protein
MPTDSIVTASVPRSCGLGETYDSKGSSMLSRQEGVPQPPFPSEGGLSCGVLVVLGGFEIWTGKPKSKSGMHLTFTS